MFGEDAPSVEQIGGSALLDGAAIGVDLVALGCCGARGELDAAVEVGAEVSVVVTSPGGEVSTNFILHTSDDVIPPTLSSPSVLDDGPDTLVLGVEGDDDVSLAGFLARANGAVVGAGPAGFSLSARRGPQRCVTVVAVDLAGNESEPREVCSELSSDDAGPGGDDGSDDIASCASTQAASAPLWGLLLALVAVVRPRATAGSGAAVTHPGAIGLHPWLPRRLRPTRLLLLLVLPLALEACAPVRGDAGFERSRDVGRRGHRRAL